MTHLYFAASIVAMHFTESKETALTVTKAEALAMWPANRRPSLRTLNRYISQGKIRKQKFHNGRVELIRSDVEALLTPSSAKSGDAV